VWRALPAPLCVQVHALAAAVLEDVTAGPARESEKAGWAPEGASREGFEGASLGRMSEQDASKKKGCRKAFQRTLIQTNSRMEAAQSRSVTRF
jgi:hypothetical protein